MSYFINIKPIFLKLCIFTNLNMVFPAVVLVFDFNESSEGVLHGHSVFRWYRNYTFFPMVLIESVTNHKDDRKSASSFYYPVRFFGIRCHNFS
jgi:hypothetical protein